MILGLHHVTATVSDPQDDLDFCTDTLGLRLVKKTVNFDNHHVYHFYYGDEHGTPGTIWTTFPYKDRGVPVGRKGAEQVTATSFSVPQGSLDHWKARLRAQGIAVADREPRFGDDIVACSDPSGLNFELVANGRDSRAPWASAVGPEAAIRGLHGVTMTVDSRERTLDLMTGLLGFQVMNEDGNRIRLAVNGDAPGKIIDVVVDDRVGPGMNGLGTVHHVAMAVGTGDEQVRFQKELIQYGCQVTEVRDRCYFTSIYFREPGGVLFEIATIPPGFTIDEDVTQLGTSLKLPWWEEPYRKDIEQHLAKIST